MGDKRINIAMADSFFGIFGYTRVTPVTDTDTTTRTQEACAYLQDKRHAAGLTQAELAQRMGITASAVSVYEGGSRTPYPRYIETAATVLQFDRDEVYGILQRVPPDLLPRIATDYARIKEVRNLIERMEKETQKQLGPNSGQMTGGDAW